MTKPALCQAGLPACCWPYAAPHACFMENTHWEDGKESPWSKTHKKGEFEGIKIPFGARVLFEPNASRPNDVPGKWEPDSIDGIFVGYEMAPGYTWSKRYIVWAVTDFDGLKLRKNILAEEFQIREPFRVSRLVVPAGDWTFPLKDRYELINSKIEGDKERAELDAPLFVAPETADPALQEQALLEPTNYAIENIPRDIDNPCANLTVDSDDDLGADINEEEKDDQPDQHEAGGASTTGGGDSGGQEIQNEDSATSGEITGSGTSEPVGPQPTSTSTPTSSSSPLPSSSSSSAAPLGKPTRKGTHGEIFVDGAGKRLQCSSYWRGDSQICTWYEIDESGARILGSSFKPSNIGTKAWAKMTEEQKLEAIAKHSSNTAGVVIECAPLGVHGLQNTTLAAQVLAWSNHDNKLEDDIGLEDYCITPDPASKLQPEVAPPDQIPPWEHWDQCIAQEDEHKKAHAKAFRVALAANPCTTAAGASTSGDCTKGAVVGKGASTFAATRRGKDLIPAMPTIPYEPKHRPKLRQRIPFNACVARPVSKAERKLKPKAMQEMMKEWKRLRDMGTWDDASVRAWRDVAREARDKNEEVHFGYLLGLCFEKGSELLDGHTDEKFKGHSVFQGDRVVNQNFEVALFQDLGSSPATLEASRARDAFGYAPGHAMQVADAPAPDVQADLKKTPCWVDLPEEAWPEDPA